MRPDASTCIRVIQPAEEPVSLFELKAQLRMDGNDEDALLSSMLTAARERIEEETRRALIRQRWTAHIRNCPGRGGAPVELPRPRLIPEGMLLEYRDAAGAWHSSDGFMVQTAREPALLWITETPSGTGSPLSPEDTVWRVTFWCGYGAEPSDVPHALRHAVLLLAVHLCEHREIVSAGAAAAELPKSMDWMLDPYRVPWGGGVK